MREILGKPRVGGFAKGNAGIPFFQEREPGGTPSGGCAVSVTYPVFFVPRSNRRVAERVSTPSGEVATIGISYVSFGKMKWQRNVPSGLSFTGLPSIVRCASGCVPP